jgi:hypothetical protein
MTSTLEEFYTRDFTFDSSASFVSFFKETLLPEISMCLQSGESSQSIKPVGLFYVYLKKAQKLTSHRLMQLGSDALKSDLRKQTGQPRRDAHKAIWATHENELNDLFEAERKPLQELPSLILDEINKFEQSSAHFRELVRMYTASIVKPFGDNAHEHIDNILGLDFYKGSPVRTMRFLLNFSASHFGISGFSTSARNGGEHFMRELLGKHIVEQYGLDHYVKQERYGYRDDTCIVDSYYLFNFEEQYDLPKISWFIGEDKGGAAWASGKNQPTIECPLHAELDERTAHKVLNDNFVSEKTKSHIEKTLQVRNHTRQTPKLK